MLNYVAIKYKHVQKTKLGSLRNDDDDGYEDFI